MNKHGKNYISTLASVTTSETTLASRDEDRRTMILFNQGLVDVQIYFEDSSIYFVLESGKGMHFPTAPINEVHAVTASGSADVSVLTA